MTSNLRRYLAHELETRIGRALLSGELTEGALIQIEVRDGELSVRFVGASQETSVPS
jgi:ATP-dependent Clp protease ATP-binding subunit ClpB